MFLRFSFLCQTPRLGRVTWEKLLNIIILQFVGRQPWRDFQESSPTRQFKSIFGKNKTKQNKSIFGGSWWWTGRPGGLRCMGSQRVGHDWATELNWTLEGMGFDYIRSSHLLPFLLWSIFRGSFLVVSVFRWWFFCRLLWFCCACEKRWAEGYSTLPSWPLW